MLKRRLLFIILAAGIFITTAIVLSFIHMNAALVPVLNPSSGTVAQMTSVVETDKPLNERLLDNLDKSSDESVSYAWNISHDNIKVDSMYEGNFTGFGKDELLIIFKLLQVPHAGGIDCSVAAVFDGGTLELLAQKTFPGDVCRFEVLKDGKGRSYLLFIGTTTNQGNSSHTLQLFKPDKGWEQLLPLRGNTSYVDSRNYEFELLPGGLVRVSSAVYKTDGSGDIAEWKKGYMLCWDPETAILEDYIPSAYLDADGKSYFDTASVSTDGKYAVVPHEWGFDGNSYVLLYNVEENKLVCKYDLLAMYFGFTWSPDGKKVCISRLARIWTDLSVLSVEDGVVAEEMGNVPEKFKSQGIKLKYELNENRPDPAYTLLEWSRHSHEARRLRLVGLQA